MVEGARLESVCWGNSTVGSNPTLSAIPFSHAVIHFAATPPPCTDGVTFPPGRKALHLIRTTRAPGKS